MPDRDIPSNHESTDPSDSEIAADKSENDLTASFNVSPADDLTQPFAENPQLANVLDQYLDDLQNGRACSRESLIAQHPHLEADLNECLEGIDMLAGLGVGSDLAPKQMGDFEIIRPIGRGAMGVVYEARQISLKRTVAVKMLRYSSAGVQASNAKPNWSPR